MLELDRVNISERYEILRHGGGGAPTTLLCGAVRFDHPAAGRRSEAAFARAFKRVVGLPPGAVKRAAPGTAATADAPGGTSA